MEVFVKQMRKNLIKILCFFIIGIFFMGFISGYSVSNPKYTKSGYGFGMGFGFTADDYQFDSRMCDAGQDFILQVSPLGCQPIVRSDLLEEQNVFVFCPVMATKINPLIEVGT